MRVAADSEPSVPVTRILERFEALFPDREALALRTGWARATIDMIDTYRDSTAVYCFPTRAEVLMRLPKGLRALGFHDSGTYDLAADCPILLCERE